jgi:hypothetical protein
MDGIMLMLSTYEINASYIRQISVIFRIMLSPWRHEFKQLYFYGSIYSAFKTT